MCSSICLYVHEAALTLLNKTSTRREASCCWQKVNKINGIVALQWTEGIQWLYWQAFMSTRMYVAKLDNIGCLPSQSWVLSQAQLPQLGKDSSACTSKYSLLSLEVHGGSPCWTEWSQCHWRPEVDDKAQYQYAWIVSQLHSYCRMHI